MYPLCEEFTLKIPGVAIEIQYFAEPMERIASDLGKGPFGRCSIRPYSDLNYVFAAPAANLIFPMDMNRVSPDDPPCLDR